MPQFAITSYVPGGGVLWDAPWPTKGIVEWSTVSEAIHPKNFRLVVHPLSRVDPSKLHWGTNARWVVLEIDDDAYVEEENIVRFDRARVIVNDLPREASDQLRKLGLPVPSMVGEVSVQPGWSEVKAGDRGVAIAGVESTATVGEGGIARVDDGTAEAGVRGVAMTEWGDACAGENGLAWVRYEGHALAGSRGIAIADEHSTAEAGDGGLAVTGTGGTSRVGDGCAFAISDCGTAEAGSNSCALTWRGGTARAGEGSLAASYGDALSPSKAIAGHAGFALANPEGIAVAGDGGIAFAGVGGAARAGANGTILIHWYDGRRKRIAVGYVGEDGIKPDRLYRADSEGNLVELDNPTLDL